MARLVCGADEYPPPLPAVAAHGLGPGARPFPSAPLDDRSWVRLVEAAWTHRVTGHLARAVADGALPATGEQAGQARAVHRRAAMGVLALDHQLAGLADLLDRAGVPFRVVKGAAVARLDYADPAARTHADLDVMVRAADIERAVATLTTHGHARTLAEPRPGFDRRFDKGMTLIAPAGHEVDLHRTFVLGPWGALMRADALWSDDGQPFDVAGRTLRALSPAHRLLHACYHAALGNWPLRLGSLRDVAEMLRSAGPDLTAAVRAAAAHQRAEALVAVAVADTHRLLGLPVRDGFARWASAYVPTRRDEAWLALHTSRDKTFTAQAIATLRVLPWRDKPAYVRALALPDPEYTVSRHASALHRVRHALADARRGSSRRSP